MRALVRSTLACACAVALMCGGAAAFAQERPAAAASPDAIDRLAGRVVTAIHLDVEGRREDAPELLALIEVRRGQPLDLVQLRASMAQLFSAGRFDDLSVRVVESGVGIELVFDLTPRHAIDKVQFDGLNRGLAADLERDLRTRYNGLPRASQVDAAARSVERALADRGFRQAKVQPSLNTTHTPDRATLVLTVASGPLTVINSARVEGNSPLPVDTVLKRARVAVGQPYRVRDVDAGIDAITEDLRARGYYEATVSHSHDVISSDGRRVDVVITIESASLVTVKFAGDPLPGKDTELVPIKREGSADDDLLEDSVRRIESALRRQGYWKGHAAYVRSETPAGKVVTITVTRGPRYRFERLEVTGNTQMTTSSINTMLDLEAGALFDESKVARTVAAVRDSYVQQGYAAVVITTKVQELPPARPDGDPRVVEQLTIEEGARTRVGEITVTGASRLSTAEVLAAMRLKKDGAFVAALVPGERELIRQRYDERGYSGAVVDVRPLLNDDRTVATIRVDITAEGPQTLLDRVIIVGNRRVSEATIRSAIELTPGQPFGATQRSQLQQKLAGMGFFRRIVITEAPHSDGEAGTDIVITVDESPTTTISYGGGLEADIRARSVEGGGTVDRFEVAPRASFEVGRTNLWGKNRSVNFFSGVSLRPKDDAQNPSEDGKCCGFSEYRAIGSLREPHAFGLNVDGLISVSAEQAIRSDFNFFRRDASAQVLKRLPRSVSLIGRYSLERVRLFNVRNLEQQLLVDRLFPRIRLSVFSLTVLRDTRVDPLSPTSGALISVDGDLAAQAIGSQFGFAKTLGQAFVYKQLPSAPRLVLAGGLRMGLLRGFVRVAPVTDENGKQIYDDNGNPVTARVEDVHVSQRFFTGGNSTVRGFQQDRLGAPNVLDANGQSNGGNGLMVINAEIRTAVTKEIGLATFFDAGNVFSRVHEMTLGGLRSSLGVGLRYRSPLGPLRFDMGWKLGTLFATEKRRWEFHFSIGEAF